MPPKPIRDAEVTFLVGSANLPTQYSVCELDTGTANQVRTPTAASVQPVGVAQADAVASKEITVQTAGIARCIASAAIAIGAFVEIASATGNVRTKAQTAAGAQPTPIVGQALTAAAAAGDYVDVLLMIGGQY